MTSFSKPSALSKHSYMNRTQMYSSYAGKSLNDSGLSSFTVNQNEVTESRLSQLTEASNKKNKLAPASINEVDC